MSCSIRVDVRTAAPAGYPCLVHAGDPIEAARALVPWWALWGGLAYPPMAFAIGLAIASAATIAAYRVPQNAHWTEKARHAFAARRAVTYCAVVSFVSAIAFTGVWYDGSLARIPPRLVALGTAIAAVLGTSLVRGRLEARIGRPVSFAARARAGVAVACVYFPHLLVAFAFTYFETAETGPSLAVRFAAGVAGVVVAYWGGGLQAARALGLARPAGPRVTAAVGEAARRGGTRVRRAFELALPGTNAVAFPHLGCLAFTERAIAVLDDDALCAIAAHELAHLDEPHAIRALRAATGLLLGVAILAIPVLASIPALAISYGAELPLLVILGVYAVLFAVRRVTRRMEERADAAARAQEPEDRRAYARALERIYEDNLVPAVFRRRLTHPHLYDRMLAAGVQPSYERPLPPPRRLPAIAISLVAVVALTLGTTPIALGGRKGDEPQVLRAIALSGGEPGQLGVLAEQRSKAGDLRAAEILYRAQAHLEWDERVLCNLSIVLAAQGSCDAARESLARAQEARAKNGAVRDSHSEKAQRAVSACVPRAD